MTTITTKAAREELTKIIDAVVYEEKKIIITRNGKKLVAVVSIKDFNLLEAYKEKRKEMHKLYPEKGDMRKHYPIKLDEDK